MIVPAPGWPRALGKARRASRAGGPGKRRNAAQGPWVPRPKGLTPRKRPLGVAPLAQATSLGSATRLDGALSGGQRGHDHFVYILSGPRHQPFRQVMPRPTHVASCAVSKNQSQVTASPKTGSRSSGRFRRSPRPLWTRDVHDWRARRPANQMHPPRLRIERAGRTGRDFQDLVRDLARHGQWPERTQCATPPHDGVECRAATVQARVMRRGGEL